MIYNKSMVSACRSVNHFRESRLNLAISIKHDNNENNDTDDDNNDNDNHSNYAKSHENHIKSYESHIRQTDILLVILVGCCLLFYIFDLSKLIFRSGRSGLTQRSNQEVHI